MQLQRRQCHTDADILSFITHNSRRPINAVEVIFKAAFMWRDQTTEQNRENAQISVTASMTATAIQRVC